MSCLGAPDLNVVALVAVVALYKADTVPTWKNSYLSTDKKIRDVGPAPTQGSVFNGLPRFGEPSAKLGACRLNAAGVFRCCQVSNRYE